MKNKLKQNNKQNQKKKKHKTIQNKTNQNKPKQYNTKQNKTKQKNRLFLLKLNMGVIWAFMKEVLFVRAQQVGWIV